MKRDEIHQLMAEAAQDIAQGTPFHGMHSEKLIRLAGLALIGLDALGVPEVSE